jgi:hypothetical protein
MRYLLDRQRIRSALIWGLASLATLPFAAQTHAALIVYDTRTAFDAANPGLAFEDFEEARVNPRAIAQMGPTLSSATSNSIFQPDEIEPGLTISTFYSGADRLLVLGEGCLTGTSKMVGTFYYGPFNDRIDVSFGAGGVHAFAADLFAAVGSGDSLATQITVTVFDTSGEQTGVLGILGIDLAAVTGGFVGIYSDVAIGRISLNTPFDTPGDEFIDNVAFGNPTPTVAAVPEPASVLTMGIGLIALASRAWLARARVRKPLRTPITTRATILLVATLIATMSAGSGSAFAAGPPGAGIADPSDWDVLITYPGGAQQRAMIRLRGGVILPGLHDNPVGRMFVDDAGRLHILFSGHPKVSVGEALLVKPAPGRWQGVLVQPNGSSQIEMKRR